MRAPALALAVALTATLSLAQQQPNYPKLDTPHRASSNPPQAQAQAQAHPPTATVAAGIAEAPASYYDPSGAGADADSALATNDYLAAGYPAHLLRRADGATGPPRDSFVLRPPVAPELIEVEDSADNVYVVRSPTLRRRAEPGPPADSFALRPPVTPESFDVDDDDDDAVYALPPKPLRRRAAYPDDDEDDVPPGWGYPYRGDVDAPPAPVQRRDEQQQARPPYRLVASVEDPQTRQIAKRATNKNIKDVNGKNGKVVLMCQHSDWKGSCWRFHAVPGVCYNFVPEYDNRVSSIGPIERGTTCYIFRDRDCKGDWRRMVYPGYTNLKSIDFNDVITSMVC